jgi:hypothetical protein
MTACLSRQFIPRGLGICRVDALPGANVASVARAVDIESFRVGDFLFSIGLIGARVAGAGGRTAPS